MILGIILIALGVIIAAYFAYTGTKKEDKGIDLFFTLIAVAFVVIGTSSVIAELTEGLPKHTYNTTGDCMPPENSPLIIKMINVENNFMYATMAPYNDQSALTPKYYRVPIENIKDLGSMEVGIMVINDNGVLRPHDKNN